MKAGQDLNGFGNMIIILHDAKHATLYAHLSKISIFVNQIVKQGDLIGLSGATGNVTGPHLHFEARRVWNNYTTHFNPMDLPLISVDDTVNTERPKLKDADSFKAGDLLTVTAPSGCKGFFDQGFDQGRKTVYKQGSSFYYTGETAINEANGYTYMRVIPTSFSVWVAVHNDDCQIVDKI